MKIKNIMLIHYDDIFYLNDNQTVKKMLTSYGIPKGAIFSKIVLGTTTTNVMCDEKMIYSYVYNDVYYDSEIKITGDYVDSYLDGRFMKFVFRIDVYSIAEIFKLNGRRTLYGEADIY